MTKIVETKIEREAFIFILQKQLDEFDAHVKRVAKQYEEIKHMKANLPVHEMITQLDFAENYSCRFMEEVQSAYFNQSSVTLHPVVAYFHSPGINTLNHRSFITVSNEWDTKHQLSLLFLMTSYQH